MDTTLIKTAILQGKTRCKVDNIDILNLPKRKAMQTHTNLDSVVLKITQLTPKNNIINCRKDLVV